MRGLPSRFATGNFTLTTLIILAVAGLLYLLDTAYVYAYVSGAVIFYGMVKLHGYRARRHKYLNPPSIHASIYNFQTRLDQMQTDLENITYQITCKPEGG